MSSKNSHNKYMFTGRKSKTKPLHWKFAPCPNSSNLNICSIKVTRQNACMVYAYVLPSNFDGANIHHLYNDLVQKKKMSMYDYQFNNHPNRVLAANYSTFSITLFSQSDHGQLFPTIFANGFHDHFRIFPSMVFRLLFSS